MGPGRAPEPMDPGPMGPLYGSAVGSIYPYLSGVAVRLFCIDTLRPTGVSPTLYQPQVEQLTAMGFYEERRKCSCGMVASVCLHLLGI